MKIDIERFRKATEKTLSFYVNFAIGFFSLGGFLMGGLSLASILAGLGNENSAINILNFTLVSIKIFFYMLTPFIFLSIFFYLIKRLPEKKK